jgi:diguanylate cyclase (GGDEF)-like protein/PAS domain S-box-containing protein
MMTGWQKQAGKKTATCVTAVACLVVIAAACGQAVAQAAGATDGTPVTAQYAIEKKAMIWQMLVGGFIVVAFLTSIILWIVAALRRTRRANLRRESFVTSALNNLSQGILMVNAQRRVTHCNNRYLELYGLTRADIRRGITGRELAEMRHARGTLGCDIEAYYRNAAASNGYIAELEDGRAIHVKHTYLPNGGVVATHEDCTEQRKMSKELARAKTFLESVIDNIPVCVAAKNIEDGRYILANRAFEQFSNIPRERIVGHRADEIFTAKTAKTVVENDRAVLESPNGEVRSEFVVELGRGDRILASNRVIARDENGRPEYLVALFEDVTGRREMSRELQSTKKFLELIVDNIPAALVVKRVNDGKYVLANRAAETILNRRREDVIGYTVEDVHPEAAARFVGMRDDAAILKGGLVTEEHPVPTDAGLRLFTTRRVTVTDDSGQPQYLIKTSEDITDRRETESRMAHMAYHDILTGLPNRAAFLQALTQLIDACGGTDEEFAVVSVDLDRLKEINDVFGHAVGDKLLIEVAKRIEKAAHGGVVARLSGDEYGLIIDGIQPEAARIVAQRLIESMREEFLIDGKAVHVGATVGVAIFPHNGKDGASLLANADAALFRAKDKSRGSVIFFDAATDQQIRDRRALHQDLSNAIRNGELSLHYQPQTHARHTVTGDDVIGFEALARWIHPIRGFIPPGDFIPLAEESGLIVEMGEWILRKACREASSWPKHLQIAVNLSPAQFMHGDLVGLVHSILLETGLTPGRLELEITEGVLIEDFDRGLSLLRRLKALGVRIAMDDFGSGYSSLTYLQAFPFDKIKIDRAFVMNLGRNPQSAAIIRAMIGLGHGLDISIVAEGVETQEQLSFLAVEACDQVQGYFLGKPAPIAQYDAWVGRDARVDAVQVRKRG